MPIALVLLTVRPVLELVGQPPEVIPDAAGYVHRNALSVWPFYVFVVLRQTLQAHHRVVPIGVTIVVANLVNVALNYAWIYGNLGFPAMGVIGSAWATTVSRWFMAAMLLALGWRTLKPYLAHVAPNLLDLRPLVRMLQLGLPIGAQMMLEFGAFDVVALLMGWLGVAQVAAHQIAINLASLTFMVPLGVSSAAAVHRRSRGRPRRCRRACGARRSRRSSSAPASCCARRVLFVVAPELLARALHARR